MHPELSHMHPETFTDDHLRHDTQYTAFQHYVSDSFLFDQQY
jgi:hypothetical protein